MTEFAPWMFLVKIETGRKPRVCRISPYEVRFGSDIWQRRRSPRAWRPSRTGGIAAIGNTVDQAYELIEKETERSCARL